MLTSGTHRDGRERSRDHAAAYARGRVWRSPSIDGWRRTVSAHRELPRHLDALRVSAPRLGAFGIEADGDQAGSLQLSHGGVHLGVGLGGPTRSTNVY
jgi:hypothetical protein